MELSKEGYIKFECSLAEKNFDFPEEDYTALETWRHLLYKQKLIGIYPDGIGFGNISIRYKMTDQFIISASATGKFELLEKKQYSMVTEYNFDSNSLSCEGWSKASSESLSHAAVYESVRSVNGVIHIHNRPLWDRIKNILPTTSETVPYGTPEMATEIRERIKEHKLTEGVVVMGGHEEGIISFGRNLEAAGNQLLELLRSNRFSDNNGR